MKVIGTTTCAAFDFFVRKTRKAKYYNSSSNYFLTEQLNPEFLSKSFHIKAIVEYWTKLPFFQSLRTQDGNCGA